MAISAGERRQLRTSGSEANSKSGIIGVEGMVERTEEVVSFGSLRVRLEGFRFVGGSWEGFGREGS